MNKDLLVVEFGSSSCKCIHGEKLWKFSSHIAPLRSTAFELGDKLPGYSWNGKTYIVGEPGNCGSEAEKFTRTTDHILHYYPVVVAHALTKLDKVPSTIAVGLPPEQYRSYGPKLVERLSEFEVDGIVYKFIVKVYAQSVGALVDYVSSHNPPADEDGYVLDIGFNTAIVLRYQSLSARSAGSKQYPQFGISRALETLGDYIKCNYGETMSLLELNEIIRVG